MFEDFRKKRESFSIKHRNEKRQNFFQHNRKKIQSSKLNQSQSKKENYREIIDENFKEVIQKCMLDDENYSLDDLPEFAESLLQNDVDEIIHRDTVVIRRILSSSVEASSAQIAISILISEKVFSKLKNFLCSEAYPQLKFEALKIFLNVSLIDQYCHWLVRELQIIPDLVQILQQQTKQFSRLAILIIGNLVHSSDELLEDFIKWNVLDLVILSTRVIDSLQIMKGNVWLINTFVSKVHEKKVNPCCFQSSIEYLCFGGFLRPQFIDCEDFLNYLWAFCFLTELCTEKTIPIIIKSHLHEALSKYLEEQILKEVTYMDNLRGTLVLRILGSTVLVPDLEDCLLNDKTLSILLNVLQRGNENFKGEAYWFLSNLAASKFPVKIIEHRILKELMLQTNEKEKTFVVDLWWFFTNLYLKLEGCVEFEKLAPMVVQKIKQLSQGNGLIEDEVMKMEQNYRLKMQSILKTKKLNDK